MYPVLNNPLTILSFVLHVILNLLYKEPAPSSRVFNEWQSSQTLGRSFRLLCYTAKIDDFKFHDLRHEATSRFYERTTLRDTEIASITGHSDMRSLRRYANLRATDLALKLW